MLKKIIVKLVLKIAGLVVLLAALAVGAWYARAKLLTVHVAKRHAMVERELQEDRKSVV